MYKALTTNNYSRGKSDLSVTQLIDSPRVRILKQRHAEEITEDASEMLWSVLGTAVHTMFEQHEPDGHIVEERLYATVGDWVISGAIDLQRSEADGSPRASPDQRISASLLVGTCSAAGGST